MDARDHRDESTPLLVGTGDENVGSSCHSSWRAELRLLADYALPLIGTYLLQYSFTVITTVVAGRLGADDLAAASIGITTMNICGLAIFEGMATALDTLCAQAFGAGYALGVGLHVQRMLLLMAVACIPVGALWLASPMLLPQLVLDRHHHIAVQAGSFLQISLLGLPGYAAFEAGKRFLQAQGGFRAAMVVLVLCAPANILLSWFFAFHLDMGLDGAALGAAIANDMRPVLLLMYIVFFGRWSHKCWPGFSHRAIFPFHEWAPMLHLSAAGSAVTLAEWAAFEILTFSTSYVSAIHLAAQTILTTTSVIMWHIPFSISVAVSTRIGHLIGAGLVPAARRASTLYTIVFITIGLLDGLVLVILRNHLGLIFSDDAAVRSIASRSMMAVGAFQVIDAINCGCNGVLRGLGRQYIAAWLVFFINYFAAVPLAIWLELGPWHMELNGVWAGLGIGMVIIVVAEGSYMKLSNWNNCVE